MTVSLTHRLRMLAHLEEQRRRRDQFTRDEGPNENHHRCMHCGDYFDECQCDGGVRLGADQGEACRR